MTMRMMHRWLRKLELLFIIFFVLSLSYLFFETVVLYFATLVKLLDYVTLFTLVHLRPLGGVIFIVVDFYYSVLPFVPL